MCAAGCNIQVISTLTKFDIQDEMYKHSNDTEK